MDGDYFVYILASKKNGTLYVGSTHDLAKRIYEHKNGIASAFTDKYNVKTLVYYESGGDMEGALRREHLLKKWNRAWKLSLIESVNPTWADLARNGEITSIAAVQ